MATDGNRDQEATRVMTMIREAIERAFDMTLPSSQVEAIVQAIYDVAADRPRPASMPATDEKIKSNFQYRIDRWDAAGDNILEHTAGVEDFAVGQAAYDRACRRWPKERITLRQGARLIQESRP
jgi:hypothetical protein